MEDTIRDFICACVSEEWFLKYEALCAENDKSHENLIFEEKLSALAEKLTPKDMQQFQTAIREQFGLSNINCTKHFLVRLLARFTNSHTSILFWRLQMLIKSCRKRKRDRASGHGLTLIMDYADWELITVMVDQQYHPKRISRGRQ